MEKINLNTKSYDDYEKVHIGESDVAALTITGMCNKKLTADVIRFIEDGSYSAYICDEEVIIPKNYEKTFEFSHWIKIFDDYVLTKKISADKIEIFQSDSNDCIIKLTKK